ncbi:transcription factor E2F6-like [Betta splendens]|uniref:Transcription factor E2F6-like n=1 Tax=Betta splendens TaxID=158456 RepID=A0A9W2XLE5_BETSP|nr:transcription factor E2F6-like [Betta splendens]
MVKCAVSGCPNQTVTGTQGVLDRPAKRFFNFPTDPAQVKVWLAALREADKQDWTERRLICEDHFLPEDVSKDGVSPDAIPIMPPYLDGLLGPSSSWAEEEEDEEAPDPPQQNPSGGLENPEAKTSANMRHMKQSIRAKSVPVERLTEQLLKLLMLAPDGSLDLRQAIRNLQIRGRRVFNIINVLHEIDLVQRDPVDSIRWIGAIPISSFLWKNQEKFRREMEKIRLVEDALDAIIEGCARQLLELTDGADDLASAYVTHEDIVRLKGFEGQTVIVVRAPKGTKMEIPSPKEDNIQVHLKAVSGPISVLASDLGSSSFITLEESRIETRLLSGSLGPRSSEQSS